VKLFARSNTAITVFKLIVPAATGIALIASGFHRENFRSASMAKRIRSISPQY